MVTVVVYCGNVLNKRIYEQRPPGWIRINNNNNNYSPRYPMLISTCFSIAVKKKKSAWAVAWTNECLQRVVLYSVCPAVLHNKDIIVGCKKTKKKLSKNQTQTELSVKGKQLQVFGKGVNHFSTITSIFFDFSLFV